MNTFKSFEEELYAVDASSFNAFAMRLFHVQAANNPVYNQYLTFLGKDHNRIDSINEIPFLPITFFKTHTVKTGMWREEKVFTSSGTTGSQPSRHFVRDASFYLRNTRQAFAQFFGPLDRFHYLALLPSYLDREGSSLIDMVEYFIQESHSPHSGFYLDQLDDLVKNLETLRNDDRRVILVGVTFALVELAEKYHLDLSHCLVMETGGMKGRRKEITREELHGLFKSRFGVNTVYSEYGMTELLSQAYSTGNGLFKAPSWMKIVLRDPEDPFEIDEKRTVGAINVIDLANFDSCAFIETQDLGKRAENGYFEVLGRIDNSDIRGCNLLVG